MSTSVAPTTRFHVNQETGNAGPCSAKIKCPFGDLATDHYDTAEAAREAYEASQNSFSKPAKSAEALKEVTKSEMLSLMMRPMSLVEEKELFRFLERHSRLNDSSEKDVYDALFNDLELERQALSDLCLAQDGSSVEGLRVILDGRKRINEINISLARLSRARP